MHAQCFATYTRGKEVTYTNISLDPNDTTLMQVLVHKQNEVAALTRLNRSSLDLHTL